MSNKPFYNPDPITHETEDILYTEKGYLDNLYTFLISSIDSPYSLSVNGSWGSGKTTLMKKLEEKFRSNGYPTLWFNPWEYERADDITFCFLIELYNFTKHRSRLKNTFKEFGIFSLSLVLSSADVIAKLITKKALSYKGVTEIHEQIDEAFRSRYETDNLVEIIKKDFAELTQELSKQYDEKPLMVFFDDLDRCLPDKALDLLEALKNLFIVKDAQVIFISGIDTNIAKQFIIKRYEGLETEFAYNYFKKIFNFTVNIPVLTTKTFEKLLTKRLDELLKTEKNQWELSDDKKKELPQYFAKLLVDAGVISIRQAYNVLNNCYFMFNMNPELHVRYREYIVLYTIKEYKSDFFETCCKLANKAPERSLIAEMSKSNTTNDPFLKTLIERLDDANNGILNKALLEL